MNPNLANRERQQGRWHKHATKKFGRLLMLLLAASALAVASSQESTAGGPAAAKAAIVASGIDGSLILCGPGEVPRDAIDQFTKLAGGAKGRVVVIRGPEASKDALAVTQRLLESWESKNVASFSVVRVASADPASQADAFQQVTQATAVWFADGDASRLRANLSGTVLGLGCDALLKRNGVIAAVGQASEVMSSVLVSGAKDANTGRSPGVGWLPDSIVVSRPAGEDGRSLLTAALKKSPGLVGYELTSGSALVVTGRRLLTVGTGAVTFHFAPSALRPAAAQSPDKKRSADLTVLRRAATARTDATFPPSKPGEPVVAKGTLVIVGGGNVGDDIVQKFIELAGGKRASVVILPAAKNDPLSAKDGMIDRFRKAGAKSVISVVGRKREEVEKKEYLDALAQATGIWFHGGRQGKILDAYEGTKVQDLIYEVLYRGGVIGGSSAGASIQTEYLVRGSPNGDQNNMFEGYERGFNFLPGVAVDQHFAQRKRFGVMTKLMQTFPQFLGIGIDESTALIVKGHVADIMGKGKIHVYDTTKQFEKGKPDYETIPSGGRLDLKARKALSVPDKTPEKKLSAVRPGMRGERWQQLRLRKEVWATAA